MMALDRLNQDDIRGLVDGDVAKLQDFFGSSEKRKKFWNSTEKIINDISKIDKNKVKVQSLQKVASQSFITILNGKPYTEITKDSSQYRTLHALASLHYALGAPDPKYGLTVTKGKTRKVTHKLAQEHVDAYCADKLCGASPTITTTTETPKQKADKDFADFKTKNCPKDDVTDIATWEKYAGLIVSENDKQDNSFELTVLLTTEHSRVITKINILNKKITETPQQKADKDFADFKTKNCPKDDKQTIDLLKKYLAIIEIELEKSVSSELKTKLTNEKNLIQEKVNALEAKEKSDKNLLVYEINPKDLSLLKPAEKALTGKKTINGPLFTTNYQTVGGLVSEGQLIKDFINPLSLDLKDQGNFAQNNGIFIIDSAGFPHIISYDDYVKKGFKGIEKSKLAFQNGPILVQDGSNKCSKLNGLSKTRSGIGIKDNKLVMIHSSEKCTINQFADICIKKGCTSAMYLDGNGPSGVIDDTNSKGNIDDRTYRFTF